MHELTGTNSRIAVRRGFSIVELLVVIGVIVILAGITVSSVLKAKRSADASGLRSELMAVGSALDQYANDFKGVYPMGETNAKTGRASGDHVLARALIGPGPATDKDAARADGYDGPGFRTMSGGRVHQPYLSPDKFKVHYGDHGWDLLDGQGTAIAYLPKRNTTIKPDVGYVWAHPGDKVRPIYDPLDAMGLVSDSKPAKCVGFVLGDLDYDQHIRGPETLRFSGPFILISAGLDKQFHSNVDSIKKSDDVYNFDR
jgi:prepilin-type N-terminal cleavage/methylation domain-containing protein